MLPAMPFILGFCLSASSCSPLCGCAQVSLLNSRLANNLTGITTIKSFTAENYEAARLAVDSRLSASNRRAIALSAAFVPLIRMLILAGFTALLLYGGMAAVAGRMSVGTYSVLVFLIQRLPLTRLGETFDQSTSNGFCWVSWICWILYCYSYRYSFACPLSRRVGTTGCHLCLQWANPSDSESFCIFLLVRLSRSLVPLVQVRVH